MNRLEKKCIKRNFHLSNQFDRKWHNTYGYALKCQDCGAIIEPYVPIIEKEPSRLEKILTPEDDKVNKIITLFQEIIKKSKEEASKGDSLYLGQLYEEERNNALSDFEQILLKEMEK